MAALLQATHENHELERYRYDHSSYRLTLENLAVGQQGLR